MSSSWSAVSLGDVVDITFGFPFKSADYTDHPLDPRLLRGDNIGQGQVRWDGCKRWPRDRVAAVRQYELRVGDVVLAMDRPWIEAGLKYASIGPFDLPALLVQRVARLRGTSEMDGRYLKYVVGAPAFTSYVLGIQTGTAVPHISGSQIKGYTFRCPSVPVQQAIATILGALDDKIELNRQMKVTLKDLARTIFKSWFVDFDAVRAKAEGRELTGMDAETAALFASRFVESELGEIPEGWRVVALDEVADFQNGLALQNFRPADGDERLPVIKIAQLRSGQPDSGEWAKADIKPECIIDDGDIVFSWSGSLMVAPWCGGRGALNQHLFRVTATKYPKWFYYGWTTQHLAEFQSIAADKATTMGHIKRHHLHDAKCIVPPDELHQAMDGLMSGLLDREIQCSVENRTLAELRDLLLPRLISGELRIPEAEKLVEDVA